MHTYTPTSPWTIPPDYQGQIVEVSYAIDAEAQVILERTVDRSDGSEVVVAYEFPANADEGRWEPWNEVPRLGRRRGRCRIELA